jgi:predicted Fe-Mo cluster-binding NifX family protein
METEIREAVPFLERVLIHAEPMERTHLRYAAPLADPAGTLSWHFGEAPYFALITVRLADGAVEEQQVLANPHQEEEKAKGIRVAEWLVARKVDVVWLKEELRGRGPVYVFGDAGVEMRATQALTVARALETLARAGEGEDERGQAV